VRRDPAHAGRFVVDKRVARWYSLQIFHLLGYRKRRARGELLIVSRRKHDLQKPDELHFGS
jgi:hypothetical protein